MALALFIWLIVLIGSILYCTNDSFVSYRKNIINLFKNPKLIFHGIFCIIIILVGHITGCLPPVLLFVLIYIMGIVLLRENIKESIIPLASIIFLITTFSIQSRQLNINEKTLNTQIQTLRTQFYPRIGINKKPQIITQSDTRIDYRIGIKNFGTIPAINVRNVVKNLGNFEHKEVSGRIEQNLTLFPKHEYTLDYHIETTHEKITKILNGQIDWEIKIIFKYEDSSKSPYETVIDYRYLYKDKSFFPINDYTKQIE